MQVRIWHEYEVRSIKDLKISLENQINVHLNEDKKQISKRVTFQLKKNIRF